MEDTPVNAAHAFANAAEEFAEKELWAKAMEAHFRAAEQFLSAMNYTSDPEAIRTLKLLYANHTRQGKELQRRLSQRVQQSPKQAVQERPGVPPQRKKLSPTQSKPSATAPQQKSNSGVRMQSHLGSRHDIGTDKMTPDLLKSGVNTPAGFASSSNSTRRAPVWSDSLTTATQNASLDGSAVTEKTIEESYMVLRGNSDSTDDDDSDPFNKFWEIVESLVSKISNPVAFATVPLNGTDPQISFDPNTIHSPLPFGNNADGVNANKDSKTDELNTAMMESYYIIPNEQKANLGNSSYQRPSPSRLHSSYKKSESKNVPTKTLEEYAMENQQLKSTLDIISKRMQAYEKAAEENSMLRSSILQFKNDFQKQAKRIKASQEMLRSIPVMKQTSPESSTVSNVNILQKRIKELEEELRLMKTDNEKQKALVTKYRERWEKLKESAKKRRVNKQGDPATQQTAEPLSSPKTTPTPDSAQLPQSPQKSRKHQSLPEINLPFALQKPSHKPGFGEILDGSTSSKSNIGTPQKNPISPTTTIVRTIETDANNVYDENSSNRSASVNNSDENSNDGINGSIETTSPLRFLSRRESGGSALPTVTTVTIEGITSLSNQKELDPDELSPSSSMMTAVTSASQSIYQQ